MTDFRKFLYSSSVTIGVGQPEVPFLVNRDLLCDRSEYFAKAFSGSFVESKVDTLTIVDINPGIFRIFVAWLYGGKLQYIPEKDNGDMQSEFPGSKQIKEDGDIWSTDPSAAKTWLWQTLIDLYIFGDRFNAPLFCRKVIDTLIDKGQEHRGYLPNHLEIKHAFAVTAKGSPIRLFLVDLFAYRGISLKKEETVTLPPEFMAAVLEIMSHRMPRRLCNGCYEKALERVDLDSDGEDVGPEVRSHPPYETDSCYYHEHESESEKAVCQKLRSKKRKR